MSDDSLQQEPPQESQPPRWQPLGPIDRRVIGVLVEKAKTTPSAYPLSLNAVVTAANQKSNRAPMMNLEPEDAEEALDRLRHLGAVAVIEGYGRVSKYRHYLYDWLGVDKVEIAVMAELLLRGAQTVGELRGRAARMEPIADLSALKPILDSLKSKGLVISLTPEGRGHVVSHALFPEKELARVRAQHSGTPAPASAPSAPAVTVSGEIPAAAAAPPSASSTSEVEELRSQVNELRTELGDLKSVVERIENELAQLKSDLGV